MSIIVQMLRLTVSILCGVFDIRGCSATQIVPFPTWLVVIMWQIFIQVSGDGFGRNRNVCSIRIVD
jgi:hypothetical protein